MPSDTNGSANGHTNGNGSTPEEPAAGHETLTTRQGHPVIDNQNTRTVGNRGPTTMENC